MDSILEVWKQFHENVNTLLEITEITRLKISKETYDKKGIYQNST